MIGSLANPALWGFLAGMSLTLSRPTALRIPTGLGKTLSYGLIGAIGLKGGLAMAEGDGSRSMGGLLLLAVILGCARALLSFGLLRLAWRKVSVPDAWGIAAHYGSVSVATFAVGLGALQIWGQPVDGGMVALMAAMEIPGLLLAIACGGSQGWTRRLPALLLHGPLAILLGTFLAAAILGPDRLAYLMPVLDWPFKVALVVFVTLMGLETGRRAPDLKRLGAGLLAFGVVMPLVGGTLGALVGWLLGWESASRFLLALLCASASYIAAPAAVKGALPEAEAGLGLGLSLGVTFPFNVLLGIPLWAWTAGIP